jgi:hypothetical protein
MVCAHELATARAEGDLGSSRLRRKEMDCDTGKFEEPDGYLRRIYRRNNNKTRSNQARVLLLCAVLYNEMSPSNAGVVYPPLAAPAAIFGATISRLEFPWKAPSLT